MAKVYVKTEEINTTNIIIDIDSDIFIPEQELTKWIQIDEGDGDKYSHAQGNYFPKEKPLKDVQGKCNYKLVDGKPIELTDA